MTGTVYIYIYIYIKGLLKCENVAEKNKIKRNAKNERENIALYVKDLCFGITANGNDRFVTVKLGKMPCASPLHSFSRPPTTERRTLAVENTTFTSLMTLTAVNEIVIRVFPPFLLFFFLFVSFPFFLILSQADYFSVQIMS